MANHPEELRFDFLEPAQKREIETEIELVAETVTESRVVGPGEELVARIDRLRMTAGRSRMPTEQRPPAAEAEEEPEEADSALSIAGFYERVRRALQGEFAGEVWVVGEIRGLREARGHRYFELADEGVESVGRGVAQALEAVCWARDWPRISEGLQQVGVELEVGRVVRVRGRVSVWEGGSKIRFTITAIDLDALLGGIAAARRRLLLALEAEGLLDANRRRPLSPVPLRIGLVTSPGSEAHRDFVGQLERSPFAFEVHLETTLVQGPEAPVQLAAALGRLGPFCPDLAVVVRGGGARGDLAAFDAEPVARAIAQAPFPVWTGIGHTGDRSVADEVAHRALITPTACGEAVVDAVATYWEGVRRTAEAIAGRTRSGLASARHQLVVSAASISRGARHQLERRADDLDARHGAVVRSVHVRLGSEASSLAARRKLLGESGRRFVAQAEERVGHRRQVLRAYEPRRQLERGWSLTRDAEGRLLRSVAEVRAGTTVTTLLADGELDATVATVRPEQES